MDDFSLSTLAIALAVLLVPTGLLVLLRVKPAPEGSTQLSQEELCSLVLEGSQYFRGKHKTMLANLMDLEEASAFACANVPRGWLSLEGRLVRAEQHLYIQQPGYGTSYLVGKMQIDALLADRRQQLGDRFRMREFMDTFNAVGLIPASLVRWEMTGRKSPELEKMLAD